MDMDGLSINSINNVDSPLITPPPQCGLKDLFIWRFLFCPRTDISRALSTSVACGRGRADCFGCSQNGWRVCVGCDGLECGSWRH